jgi:Methylamine utilisation protein MauE
LATRVCGRYSATAFFAAESVDGQRLRVLASNPGAYVVAVALAWAAWTKLRAPRIFREHLADYEVFPYWTTQPLAFAVPFAEAATAALLVIERTRPIGASAALLLTLAFAGVLSVPLRRGRKIACACFGGSSELDTVGPHTFVRASLLFAFSIWALIPAGTSYVAAAVEAGLLAVTGLLATETTRLFTDLRESISAVRVLTGEHESNAS